MKSLVVVLALVLTSAAAGPAGSAASTPRLDWGFSNDARQVLMKDTEPTAADPHVHVKFKRYGGKGQRQVRIVERQMNPATPWHKSDRVKLKKGEKAVFTTVGSLPCEPAKRPLQVKEQMRIKLPGEPWRGWVTWSLTSYVLLDCTEGQ
jgi:hypothetical protein